MKKRIALGLTVLVLCFSTKVSFSKEVSKGESLYHIVEKGDTLKGISKKYKQPVKKIAKVNKIEDINLITVGDKLKVAGIEFQK